MAVSPLVDVVEVSAYLNVSPGWVYKHREVIPHRKIGKYLRFDLQEVVEWAAQRHPSSD